jgi:hypothetical protein
VVLGTLNPLNVEMYHSRQNSTHQQERGIHWQIRILATEPTCRKCRPSSRIARGSSQHAYGRRGLYRALVIMLPYERTGILT